MVKYNDDLLTPENYELMAKEYSKSIKKNIKFVEIKIDENKKQELKNQIVSNYYIISNCIKYLNKCNLNINKKKLLHNICESFENHTKFVEKIETKLNQTKNNPIIKNYCACLSAIINCCINSIDEICNKRHYINDDEDYFYEIKNLTTIINYSTQMFGVCKYRD